MAKRLFVMGPTSPEPYKIVDEFNFYTVSAYITIPYFKRQLGRYNNAKDWDPDDAAFRLKIAKIVYDHMSPNQQKRARKIAEEMGVNLFEEE